MFGTKKLELYWVLGIHEFTGDCSDDNADDEAKKTCERDGIKPDGSSSNGGVRSMEEEQDDEETEGKSWMENYIQRNDEANMWT
jgi:hypothetical protein